MRLEIGPRHRPRSGVSVYLGLEPVLVLANEDVGVDQRPAAESGGDDRVDVGERPHVEEPEPLAPRGPRSCRRRPGASSGRRWVDRPPPARARERPCRRRRADTKSPLHRTQNQRQRRRMPPRNSLSQLPRRVRPAELQCACGTGTRLTGHSREHDTEAAWDDGDGGRPTAATSWRHRRPCARNPLRRAARSARLTHLPLRGPSTYRDHGKQRRVPARRPDPNRQGELVTQAVSSTEVDHPLASLTADEIAAAVAARPGPSGLHRCDPVRLHRAARADPRAGAGLGPGTTRRASGPAHARALAPKPTWSRRWSPSGRPRSR